MPGVILILSKPSLSRVYYGFISLPSYKAVIKIVYEKLQLKIFSNTVALAIW